MFGDPTELVKSADTTRTAAERDAIATNGMCSVLDEVGMLKNPDGLTYLLRACLKIQPDLTIGIGLHI